MTQRRGPGWRPSRRARVAVIGGLLAAGLATAGAVPVGAATTGSWSTTAAPSDVRAVHVALLRSGKVLLAAGSGNNRGDFNAGTFKTSIWDPATGNLKAVATPWDAFCSGHSFMADGRLLVAGGTTAYTDGTPGSSSSGSNRSYFFDPVTEQYVATGNMHVARWYPTVTELGDGRQFALGGLDENGDRTSSYETFDGVAWSTPRGGPSRYVFQPMYPAMHL